MAIDRRLGGHVCVFYWKRQRHLICFAGVGSADQSRFGHSGVDVIEARDLKKS